MTDTVLVTGGTGYIAQWCIVELLNRGYSVRTTIRAAVKEQGVRAAVATLAGEAAHSERLTFALADLTDDAGWDAAVAGVDLVLHVASPLSPPSDDPEDMIRPARDGALRVLRAATAAGSGVKRVVQTSAANAASLQSYTQQGVTDETLWTDATDPALPLYRRSKTLAERAAWDFMADYDGPTTFATVLPGAVFGPILSADNIGSAAVIQRMLRGRPPLLPRIGFEVIDVRDLVDLHLRAMIAPEAAGQRFLGTGDFLWMTQIAAELRAELGAAARKVPTRRVPDFVVRLLARRDASLAEIAPALGRRNTHSTEKARTLLAWSPRSGREAVLACAESLVAHGAA